MSNTVRRPRRRPRHDSCAWKSFGWLLRRAVVYAMIEEHGGIGPSPAWRRWLRDSPSPALAGFVAHLVKKYPGWRYVHTARG